MDAPTIRIHLMFFSWKKLLTNVSRNDFDPNDVESDACRAGGCDERESDEFDSDCAKDMSVRRTVEKSHRDANVEAAYDTKEPNSAGLLRRKIKLFIKIGFVAGPTRAADFLQT